MEIGYSRITDTILRFISDDSKNEIEKFVTLASSQQFLEMIRVMKKIGF